MTAADARAAMYELPDSRELKELAASIVKSFRDFMRLNGFGEDFPYVVRDGDITDIAIRVHKRVEYYRFFHGIKASQRKVSALQAYWIVKFHPFVIECGDGQLGDSADFFSLVNEHFAAYLMFAPIVGDRFLSADGGGGGMASYEQICGSEYYEKLLYSLRYRNLSIDALVLLAETITLGSFDQSFTEAARAVGSDG